MKKLTKFLAVGFLLLSSLTAAADITFSGGDFYFDNSMTNWNDGKIELVAHQYDGSKQSCQDYIGATEMSPISNTKLYYVSNPAGSNWGKIWGWRVMSNANAWGSDCNSDGSIKTYATHRTATTTYGCDNGTIYLITPSTNSNDCSIVITNDWDGNKHLGYEWLNKTQTVKVMVKAAGGSYSEKAYGSWPATIKAKRYKLNSNGASKADETDANLTGATFTSVITSTAKIYKPTANTGYTFKGWGTSSSATPSNASSDYEYTVADENTIYLFFDENTYSVTAAKGTGCASVNPTGAQTVGQITGKQFTATGETGYYFVNWTSSNGGTFTSSTSETTTFKPTGDATITANYAENLTAVTISSNGNGTVDPASANVGVATTQSVTATPFTGYHFVSWAVTGNADIKSNTTDNPVTLYGNGSGGTGTLKATFAETTYSITVAAGANGSVASASVSAGQITSVALPTATPDDGYNFKNWTATDGITITNPTSASGATIIATKAGTVTANFESAATYSLTVVAGEGITSVFGGKTDQTTLPFSSSISATVKTGYTFEKWTKTGDGNVSYTSGSATDANATVSVSEGSVTLTASATPNTTTAYTVKHYKQNLAGTDYELADTDNLTGTTDASVTPAVKSYEGFIAPSTQTVTIKGDGTTEVTYNYTRNSYTLTWAGLEGATTQGGTSAGSVKYGATLTAPVVEKTGYNFTGWNPSVPATMPASDVTYTAQWSEITHIVTIENGTTTSTTAGVETEGTATVRELANDEKFTGWTIPAGVTLTQGTTTSSTTIHFHANADNLTVTANIGKKTLVKLYFANYAEWPTVTAYAYGNGEGNNNTWPGELTTEETINCVTYKVFSYYSEDHSWTTVIFNNGQDQDNCKTGDLTIAGNEGHYYMPNGWKQGSTGLLTGEWQAEPYATLWAFHIKESGADHGQDYLVSCDNNQTTASLEANTHYVFKAHNYVTGKWYGNNNGDSYIRGSIENWDFYSENTGDCNMQTTEAGTYTFAISQFVTSSQIKVSVTYPAAETFAVTISADDNGSVEPNGEQQVDAFNGISVTAKPNPGYRFKQWVTSDGVTVTNSTNATTTVKASKAGTLQATFTTEGMIYFNKTGISSKWTGDVYVYFYKGEYWDKDHTPSNGSGSKTSANCTSGPHKMNRLGNSQIYYFDYAGAGITKQSNVISFTDQYLSEADNFFKCSASYRTDFHTCANMFVPRDYIDYYNQCAYYSKGYWRTFQSTDPGYDITIWNNHDGTGDQKAHGDFVGTSNLSNDFTFTANLDGNHTYGFKISSCGGTWYGNQGTMTQDCNWEFDSEGTYTNNCGLTTTATGEYKFTLNCTDGWLRVSVEYPLSVGDYRLAYEELNGVTITDLHPTHFIKAIKEDGTKKDTVSFFVQQKANACIHLQKCTHIEGTNITWTNEDGKKVDLSTFANGAGVYNFTLTQTKSNETLTPEVALLEAYKGPYYIRTDCAGGGWSAYDIADNEMTQSNILAQNANGFDHYFVKWVAANTNVKYCVANNYSEALTDSLKGDTYIGEDKQVLPQDANVRFMWNSKTNALERAYLSGSTNTEDRYLVLEGDAKMFFANGDVIGEGSETDHRKGLHANELNFTDKNNWVYQADIKAQPGCAVKLTAAYNGNIQYFIGKAEGEGATKTIINSTTTGSTNKYTMRVVYDYKTNLLVAGWVPSNTPITENISLGGDMLISRTHQDDAQQITFGVNQTTQQPGSVSNIKHIYGVLTLQKDVMTGTEGNSYNDKATNADYDKTMYWISFPFDVKISEIFGVDGYGKKWIIQKYNGAKRAKIGWFKGDGTETFWEFMDESETLNAYEGYLFLIDANYFNTADADVWKNSATEANFYFPSASGEIGIVKADNFSQPVSDEYHICHIDRNFKPEGMDTEMNHTITDSHWNVIGVPAFQNASGSVVPSDNNFKAFYEWNSTTNGYNVRATADSYEFKTMYAYMTQFYGTINWTNVSVVSKPTTAPYRYTDEKNYMIELFFNGNGAEDHTYIKLADEASTDFVLNEDMMKIDNAGFPNIYSFAGNYNVAYNETKKDNQTVMLGVSAPKDGNYTFAMPKDFSGTAKLVDLVEGITTDLNVANYSVDLNKGTYNNRFQLVLEVEAKTPTSIEADGQRGREADGKTTKLLRNGNIYLINGGRVYNVLGVEE